MYGVVGKPILFSLSPLLYKNYIRLAVDSVKEAVELKDQIGLKGINVTAPFKGEAFKIASRVSEYAKKAEAANILLFNDNEIYADNSDIDAVIVLAGKKNGQALVLGAGGAGRAAKVALKELGFNVAVWNRSKKDGTIQTIPENKFDLIVNTVPEPPILNIDIDSRYDHGGILWLKEQAKKTSLLFYDQEFIDPGTLTRDFNPRLIYLTGMMGVGKTTTGRALAEKLGVNWHDTDNIIEEREGKTIEEIFNERGEEYFRDLEREVISTIHEGVVSVGGGIVSGFKEGSLVVVLVEDKEILKSRIQDRPLRHKFDELYEKRMPLLFKASKLVIRSKKDTAERLHYEISETFKY